MLKRALLLGIACVLSTGVSCTITGLDDILGPIQIPLDQADASISISQSVGTPNADVIATITDSRGRVVDLSADQAVRVNGAALVGPNTANQYTLTVAAAATYDITVREPTRGVQDTTIAAPAAFDITVPTAGGGASLSGFTLRWSNANELLQVEIRLTEIVFGTRREVVLGPFTDTGSRLLRAVDLQDFVQGTDLIITVTKINRTTVAGFDSATVTARVSASQTAVPLP